MSGRTLTTSLVRAWDGAVQALEEVEHILDAMGLLKSRSKPGALHTDRVLKSIELDKRDGP